MTNVIRPLDPRVVSRIAAGEVINSPSNAIKEIVENSIDAKSSKIIIEIERGGIDLIRVSDDGCGISKSDLPIACKAHTTSKLCEFSDLQKISTFGFRGEALHSISCVSHLKITTKTENDPIGSYANYVEGELDGNIGYAACTKGTIIEAKNLFYNYPLRLNGIKPRAESNKITDIVSKYAVIHPQISFIVRCDKKETLMTYGGNSTSETVMKLIFGLNNINFFRLSFDINNQVFVHLFMSEINTKVKKRANALFINERLVKNQTLQKRMEEVYGSSSIPFSFITLKMPPENVDVNVHPKKERVQFLGENEIVEEICEHINEEINNNSNNAQKKFPIKQKENIFLNPKLPLKPTNNQSIITAFSENSKTVDNSSKHQINLNQDNDLSDPEAQSPISNRYIADINTPQNNSTTNQIEPISQVEIQVTKQHDPFEINFVKENLTQIFDENNSKKDVKISRTIAPTKVNVSL